VGARAAGAARGRAGASSAPRLDVQRAARCQEPATPDVPAAVATAEHWLAHAGSLAGQRRDALSNAQVATGGLAYAGNDEEVR